MSLDVNFSEPDEFNCSELHSCIKTVAQLKNIEDFTYHVDYVCGKGENYIANVFRVLIKDSNNRDNNVSVIVKTLVNTSRQELFHELHKREVIAYRDVIGKFMDIQKDLHSDDQVIFPECITSSIEKGNEVIILEDLLVNGFEIDPKVESFQKLDFNRVSLVMTEMAKFHALSFVYENVDSNKYTDVSKNFHDLMFRDDFVNESKLRDYFFGSYEMSLNLISDLEAQLKLENIKPQLFDILKKYSQPSQYNVFCHGDCWINNILFKQEEKKTKMCFLDFQAMRYANPVTDIIYFLYICTDSQFRSKHLKDIKEIYYNSIKSFLKQFNIEAHIVYPKEEFEKNMEKYLPFGLLMALIELRIVTPTLEDDVILQGSEIEEFEVKVAFKETLLEIRINDVVKEATSNGVLNELCKVN